MKRVMIVSLLMLLLISSCSLSRLQDEVGPAPEKAVNTVQQTVLPEKATESPLVQPDSLAAPTVPATTELVLGMQIVGVNAADMMTVNTPDFTLTGQAPEGTVISANNQFALVGTDQKFAFPLSLVEGPNLIEIEASNSLEQTAAINLVLIYAPSP